MAACLPAGPGGRDSSDNCFPLISRDWKVIYRNLLQKQTARATAAELINCLQNKLCPIVGCNSTRRNNENSGEICQIFNQLYYIYKIVQQQGKTMIDVWVKVDKLLDRKWKTIGISTSIRRSDKKDRRILFSVSNKSYINTIPSTIVGLRTSAAAAAPGLSAQRPRRTGGRCTVWCSVNCTGCTGPGGCWWASPSRPSGRGRGGRHSSPGQISHIDGYDILWWLYSSHIKYIHCSLEVTTI